MATGNPFAAGISYLMNQPKTKTPQPAPQIKHCSVHQSKRSMVWRAITDNQEVQQFLVDLVNKHGDASYGETTVLFQGKDFVAAAISEEMVETLVRSRHEDFVLLYRPSESYSWSLSKRHTKGDLAKYLGEKVAGRYRSPGEML